MPPSLCLYPRGAGKGTFNKKDRPPPPFMGLTLLGSQLMNMCYLIDPGDHQPRGHRQSGGQAQL